MVLIISLFIYGLFLSQFNVSIIPESISPKHPKHFYDYSGVTNINTFKSTGSGSLIDVIKAAQKNNLDFIFISDLNQFPYTPIPPRYVNNLTVFTAHKFSFLNAKIINYFPDFLTGPKGLGLLQVQWTELFSKLEKDSDYGIHIISHPFKTDYSWNKNIGLGIDGIEILNLKKIWQSNWQESKLSFLWTMILYPFNPRLSFLRLFKDQKDEVDLWNKLLKQRPTMGFSGADAEAKATLFPGSYVNYPTYQDIFQISKNHILLQSELTGDHIRDANKIAQAIKKGQFYFSLDLLANPKGFEAYLQNSNKDVLPLGTKVKLENGLKFIVDLPQKPTVPFDVVFFKDGIQQELTNSKYSEFSISSPGSYNIQVKVIPTLPLPDGKKWITWIYTNSVYVE